MLSLPLYVVVSFYYDFLGEFLFAIVFMHAVGVILFHEFLTWFLVCFNILSFEDFIELWHDIF